MWFSCKKTISTLWSLGQTQTFILFFISDLGDWGGRASSLWMFHEPLWIRPDVWYFLILTSLLILIPGACYFCERAGRLRLCSSCVMFICGGWRSSSSGACRERRERRECHYSLLLWPKICWKSLGDGVHGAERWERLFRWSVPPRHNDLKWID